MKRKKTFPPPFSLFQILVSLWNVGSLSSWAIFFFSPPDGKCSLTGETKQIALSRCRFKTSVQPMECCAGVSLVWGLPKA